jgi:hypothetical protein
VKLDRARSFATFVVVSVLFSLVLSAFGVARADDDGGLLPEPPVEPEQILASGPLTGGGSGGQTSSTSSATNTFSPATYVDYKRIGGEPTIAVDRYPFTPGQFGNTSGSTQYRDLAYGSAPLGLPTFSWFMKSEDLGQSFHLSQSDPFFGRGLAQGDGGGDSHHAVGQVTHRVFLIDLPGDCVHMNISDDLGETFGPPDENACAGNVGAVDDRQWVAADELHPGTKNVYVSFKEFFAPVTIGGVTPPPTLVVTRSVHDGDNGTFETDSTCKPPANSQPRQPDSTPTACADPSDPNLDRAGPVIADVYNTHNVYVPFIRRVRSGDTSGPVVGWQLYIAKSTDGGSSWTRKKVADLPVQNYPGNDFPLLAIDKAGNLYFTWSQTTSSIITTGTSTNPPQGGEQDVYYTYSTTQGAAWAPPIPLTQETGDSAVFPWIVAGDPGQVDIAFYRSNSGLNSNIAAADTNTGQSCNPFASDAAATCKPAVWNVMFDQSQSALNPGSNFKSVQISDHPNHVGAICTSGLGCPSGGRNLLDFFTVDVDHLGAANVIWSDDNNSRRIERAKFSRQIAGQSVFKNTPINLQGSWPVTDHSATDRSADVRDALAAPNAACPGMDILGVGAQRSGDQLTVSLTLNGPPTSASASLCSNAGATGGLWGVEFWAGSETDATDPGGPNDNFYLAYRDNPGDVSAPTPAVEAGRVNSFSASLTAQEFHRIQPGTLGGSCFTTPPPTGACTITMTTTLSTLGIKSGAGLYSVTGLSTYYYLSEFRPPLFRVPLGFSVQADAAPPFNVNGTGTLTK